MVSIYDHISDFNHDPICVIEIVLVLGEGVGSRHVCVAGQLFLLKYCKFRVMALHHINPDRAMVRWFFMRSGIDIYATVCNK